ncbi:MAG TPA: Ig domain-containing protein [Chthoniobacteraceae bacterium]|jgi:hypothetical protein
MKPIIDETMSVPGWLQWEEFAFQPYARNTPTSWTASNLPAGVGINGTTGLISGAAETRGIYNIGLQAHNADGSSPVVVFTFGFEGSIEDPTANVIDLRCDLGTRAMSGDFMGDVGATPADLDAEDARKLTALGLPLWVGKRGDGLLFRVQMQRGGVVSAVSFTELNMAIKELETEDVIAESTAFHSLGGGAFLVFLPLTDDRIVTALENYEGDYGTSCPVITELEWLATNPLPIGGALRGSSRNFRGDLVRDIIT